MSKPATQIGCRMDLCWVPSQKNAHESVCLSLVLPASGFGFKVLCCLPRVLIIQSTTCSGALLLPAKYVSGYLTICCFPQRNFRHEVHTTLLATCSMGGGETGEAKNPSVDRPTDTPKTRFVHGFNHRVGQALPGNHFGKRERQEESQNILTSQMNSNVWIYW